MSPLVEDAALAQHLGAVPERWPGQSDGRDHTFRMRSRPRCRRFTIRWRHCARVWRRTILGLWDRRAPLSGFSSGECGF